MNAPTATIPGSNRGSALLTVLMLSLLILALSGTMLKYSLSERALNERNRLNLRARVMAENIANYSAAQVSNKLYAYGTAPVGRFAWTGTGMNRVYMPGTDILENGIYTDPTVGMEMRCGILAATPYATVTDPDSEDRGLQTSSAKVEVIAKATANHPLLGQTVSYVQQDLELVLKPLFQFGMFYNMDLELYPNPTFTLSGPVHSNKKIMAHMDGSSTNTMTFLDRVSTAIDLIADHSLKAIPRNATGALNPPTASSGNIMFTNANSPYNTVNMKSGSTWQDSRWNSTTYPPSATADASFRNWANSNFNGNLRTRVHGVEELALPGVGSYDQTTAPNNGREIIESPDHKRYNGVAFNWTTDSDVVKRTKISWRAGLYIMVNPDDQQREGKLPDGTIQQLHPYSYRCWLNYFDTGAGVRVCREVVLPGQPSWGFSAVGPQFKYKNTLPNRYTNTTMVGRNQVLRIPMASESAAGALAVTNLWDGGRDNPLVADPLLVDESAARADIGDITTGYPSRISAAAPVYPAFPANNAAVANIPVDEGYFFDIRRADNNGAATSASGTSSFGRSATYPYTPRPIAKIDLDMARLKLMVARAYYGSTQTEGYQLERPDVNGNRWGQFIYNPAAVTAANNIQLGVDDVATVGVKDYVIFPDAANPARRDPFQLYYVPPVLVPGVQPVLPADPRGLAVPIADFSAAWYDGIAIYIHSLDAERRADGPDADLYPDRIDSGLRLWNGRGPVASLTAATKTGCTIATNDAVYIIGHYNADGNVQATSTNLGTGSPNFFGGYSAKYPDEVDEKLCAVMGDAVTIVSQPVFQRSGAAGAYTYEQINGWCDSLSAFPVSSASSSTWQTDAAGNTDGLYHATATIYKSGFMPQRNNHLNSTAVGRNTKLDPVITEVSTALLVGIVPSHHNPSAVTDRAPSCANGATQTISGIVGNNVNSGGANNFPRLLDNWSGTGLYIRGSMVAMFESRVAMEPFSHGRCYTAPSRYWGLHYNFSQAQHDVPLEPIVIAANTLGFRELTQTQYNTAKTTIEGMTVIP